MTNDIIPIADRLALQATKQHDIIINLIKDLEAYCTFLEDSANEWKGKL